MCAAIGGEAHRAAAPGAPRWDWSRGRESYPWVAVGAGCCASAGKRANASTPSQSEMLRFMFFSLGAAANEAARGLNQKVVFANYTSERQQRHSLIATAPLAVDSNSHYDTTLPQPPVAYFQANSRSARKPARTAALSRTQVKSNRLSSTRPRGRSATTVHIALSAGFEWIS